MKNRILYWLPVILLPAGNLLMLFFAPMAFIPRTLLFSLIGAMTEELFFRGLLLREILLPRMKPILAIMLASIFFAAMHLLNLWNGTLLPAILPQMFCAFGFSIWAGAVVWKTNRVMLPLLAHVLLNLTAVTDGTILSLIVSVVVLVDGILLMKTEAG